MAMSSQRESEAQWRALAEALPLIVWSARTDGCVEYQNSRWYEFTGLPDGSVGDGWRELVHPEDLLLVTSRWDDSMRTGETFEVEYRLRRKDGAYRWLLSRGVPERDAEGRMVRWFGTCTDISEIVAAREAIAQEADRLEHIVAQRTRDLQETQIRLAHAQRMEALGQLAGGIAHDFNNVLQAVQGGTSLIEQCAGNAERTRRLARTVLSAAERGMAITRRLLAFSRYSDLRSQPVDAASLLTGMAEIFATTLGGGIEVGVEFAPELPLLLADKGQLETVLINLATNARDAMAGAGRLTLAASAETRAADDGRHAPLALKPGDYVRLSVSDTGCGMDAETLARAGEPFFTTKPVGKGTGLGLSMAKGFVEQSGGGLHVASAPGRGTTVTLWLPIAARSPAGSVASHEPGGGARVAGERACVLVVDDEGSVREIIAEQLEMLGYAALAAGSGPEALALLDQGAPVDLVLCDLSMPGMDGIALIREAQRRCQGLPAILLTGLATQAAELVLGGMIRGNCSVLVKPVSGQTLADRVAVLLESSRLHSRYGRSEP